MTPAEFKAIRLRLGKTQAQLAEYLDYGKPIRISEFERETNPRPVPRHLAWLMEALDAGFVPKGRR